PRAAGVRLPAADTAAIRTSRDGYRLTPDGPGWRLEIVATYTNRTGRAVYVRHGGGRQPGFRLEKREGDAWTAAFAPAVPLVAEPPSVVAPGASRTDTLVVLASAPGLGAPAFTVDSIPGTYRVVYDLYATSTVESMVALLSDPLPVEARSSNPFQLDR
ncbi:MAG: hypothetical protein JWM27_3065, partial [Gemmatimonadetes bacterium]|nr:hypothetical protein [Gemmatimonadota bacterium]